MRNCCCQFHPSLCGHSWLSFVTDLSHLPTLALCTQPCSHHQKPRSKTTSIFTHIFTSGCMPQFVVSPAHPHLTREGLSVYLFVPCSAPTKPKNSLSLFPISLCLWVCPQPKANEAATEHHPSHLACPPFRYNNNILFQLSPV